MIVSHRIVRIDGEDLPELGERFVRLPCDPIGFTEIGACGKIARIEQARPADQLDRQRGATYLEGDETQMMEGIGVVRFRGENLPIQRLGLGQLAGLVALGGRREGLLGGERGHRFLSPCGRGIRWGASRPIS